MAEGASGIEKPGRVGQEDSETNMSRLLHEPAWARMFGKLEAKKPFALTAVQ